jgi:hypothetical protein
MTERRNRGYVSVADWVHEERRPQGRGETANALGNAYRLPHLDAGVLLEDDRKGPAQASAHRSLFGRVSRMGIRAWRGLREYRVA